MLTLPTTRLAQARVSRVQLRLLSTFVGAVMGQTGKGGVVLTFPCTCLSTCTGVVCVVQGFDCDKAGLMFRFQGSCCRVLAFPVSTDEPTNVACATCGICLHQPAHPAPISHPPIE